ncbi:FKBP-type peptidyl-prolyl cis-trans isomerase [uncultured Mucilaginibacter sp.]|uniref:FKBP-type peptidyl-prolyl cis-trans isomerase n=1 Tax=uncultured Mucilaginibacter sp. TaxID=797541 RepID=UPI002609A3FD|nr:FKBP-type peptidyl-prolyl cis-trans isomerase [uncultured Mucilaginibacter sp.]
MPAVDPAVQAKIDDDKIQAYLKANPSITATKDASGLYYQVITAGTGVNPTTKSTITVAYTGKYLDGTSFQTASNFTSVLGAGLIQGWQIGIPFVKTGGRILLIIPSALAYGPAGRDPIPPNTVLIFTIDLFAVQG